MSQERPTQIAMELLKLGVSHSGIQELLVNYPYDVIERQISFMPYRKAKRPEAFIMEAVRRNYSPPKEFFYAKNKAKSTTSLDSMDQGSKRRPRQAHAETQGHRTENHSSSD